MIVAIIGAGAWGTALAIAAARGGADVRLWSFDGKTAEFEGADILPQISVTRDMAEIKDADAWLIATPSEFFANTMAGAAAFYNNQPIIICTKGADAATGQFMSQILARHIPGCADVAVLAGPQFAAELARGVPTGSTVAGTKRARDAAHGALGTAIDLEDSDDIIGAEFCGTGKNAMALISGYLSVCASGENARALIFTRAWGEVIKIALAHGAKIETFSQLCGIGDLFLSATSTTSRNFSGGIAIAHGEVPVGTVEGICALRGLLVRARNKDIAAPTLYDMAQKMDI